MSQKRGSGIFSFFFLSLPLSFVLLSLVWLSRTLLPPSPVSHPPRRVHFTSSSSWASAAPPALSPSRRKHTELLLVALDDSREVSRL